MLQECQSKSRNGAGGSPDGTGMGEARAGGDGRNDANLEKAGPAGTDARDPSQEVALHQTEARPKILVVGKEDSFTERVMDYTVNLAQRLGYDIIAMNVNTVVGQSGAFLHPFKHHLRETFEIHAAEAAELLRRKAFDRGIEFEHVVRYEEVSKAVKQLHHERDHIELVVTEPEYHPDGGDTEIAIPVYSILKS
jgi:hypothetical protein